MLNMQEIGSEIKTTKMQLWNNGIMGGIRTVKHANNSNCNSQIASWINSTKQYVCDECKGIIIILGA